MIFILLLNHVNLHSWIYCIGCVPDLPPSFATLLPLNDNCIVDHYFLPSDYDVFYSLTNRGSAWVPVCITVLLWPVFREIHPSWKPQPWGWSDPDISLAVPVFAAVGLSGAHIFWCHYWLSWMRVPQSVSSSGDGSLTPPRRCVHTGSSPVFCQRDVYVAEEPASSPRCARGLRLVLLLGLRLLPSSGYGWSSLPLGLSGQSARIFTNEGLPRGMKDSA